MQYTLKLIFIHHDDDNMISSVFTDYYVCVMFQNELHIKQLADWLASKQQASLALATQLQLFSFIHKIM